MTIHEGVSRAVERPRPNSDIVVCAIADGTEVEKLVRIAGLDVLDYLAPAEALALARALVAAVDEVSSDDELATSS